MEEIQGIVEKIVQREKNYGLKLKEDERWFNGWGTCLAIEGEKTSFKYSTTEKNGRKYFDIDVLNVEGKKQQPITQDQAKISVRVLEFTQKELNLILAALHCYEATVKDLVAFSGGNVEDLFDDVNIIRRYIHDNIIKQEKNNGK